VKYKFLGKTDIRVSQLCFGTLTISPLQRNLPLRDGLAVMEKAIELGVNFFDTAELYDTYTYLKEALKTYPSLVISTKSYAYDRETAEKSFIKAVKGIGREYIDIFMLHEQESIHTIRGHWEALEYFIKLKDRGYIGAVGISTHRVSGVKDACKFKEIQIIHPIINMLGIGITDGTRENMEAAIMQASLCGKGIFAMKPLGGGHLIPRRDEALDYILSFPYVDSIALGMQNQNEVEYNVKYFDGDQIENALKEKLQKQKRCLYIHDWCKGCGSCVKACRNGALHLEQNMAVVDPEKCVLCGYCVGSCTDFCIKVL